MAVERVFTIEVSALAHAAILLPVEHDIGRTVRDALGKEYPNTSLRVSIHSEDVRYGKESK